MARIGILGGTFDPVHIGHLVAATEVRWALELDRVLMVVANAPWQKAGHRRVTPAEHRLAMVAAALEGVDGVEASDIEIARGGETYTADTVATLRESEPDAVLFLVIGTDVANDLHTWMRTDELRREVTLAVVDRAGDAADIDALTRDGWRAERVRIPSLESSSSDIRERVCLGKPIDFLVPPGAIRYLREHRLYAEPG